MSAVWTKRLIPNKKRGQRALAGMRSKFTKSRNKVRNYVIYK